MMDLRQTIESLNAQKEKLESVIAVLEELQERGTGGPGG